MYPYITFIYQLETVNIFGQAANVCNFHKYLFTLDIYTKSNNFMLNTNLNT